MNTSLAVFPPAWLEHHGSLRLRTGVRQLFRCGSAPAAENLDRGGGSWLSRVGRPRVGAPQEAGLVAKRCGCKRGSP